MDLRPCSSNILKSESKMIPLERKGEPDTPRPQLFPRVYPGDRVRIAPSPSLWPPRHVGVMRVHRDRTGHPGVPAVDPAPRLCGAPPADSGLQTLELATWEAWFHQSHRPPLPITDPAHSPFFGFWSFRLSTHDRRGKCRSQ